jgi:8-oxo-dGTP pyrophosphatase MutT (NUDIX family)
VRRAKANATYEGSSIEAMTELTYARRSARVLLLDSADRLLLLGYENGEWFTPGGGLDDGEQPRQAAVRELREEIGLHIGVDELGPLVAISAGHANLGWVNGLLRDDFFLHRVTSHEVDFGGLAAHERYTANRWWTVDELASTDEVIYPLKLAPLVADLVGGRIPGEPVRLPWHH